jgi:radical SAM protein with 4Fe4S-binding SPASM domain
MLMIPEFRLGTVGEGSLRQILNSPRLRELEHLCAVRRTLIEECSSCHWRSFCQGSCPGSIYLDKGTMLATDDLCAFRRQLYRETVFNLARGRLQEKVLHPEPRHHP